MLNPAYELAEILEGWTVPANKTPRSARAEYASSIGEKASEVATRAMRCIVEIRDRVDALEQRKFDVTAMRYGYPRWLNAIISADLPFNAGAVSKVRPAIAPDHLNQLRLLGSVLDAHAIELMPRPDALERMEQAVDDAEAAVVDLDVPEGLKQYLRILLGRVREALKVGHAGNYLQAVNEFVGALHVCEAMEQEPEARSVFKRIREDFLVPVAAGATANLLSAGVLLALPAAGL